MILLHSRAFPVNVDSFGEKKLIVTLEVEYEALGNRRRRLLTTNPTTDINAQAKFRLNSFQPKNMPKGLNGAASMILDMTLHSAIDRNNVNAFTNSFRGAIVTALNAHPLSKK